MSEALSPLGVPRIYGDVPPFMAFPHVRDPASFVADAVVVGMPYDGLATFRGGATRRAPQEIRKYSLLYGTYSFDWDMDLSSHIAVADAGDIDVVPGDNAESYARLGARLGAIQSTGAIPVTIGGDHGISYPAVRAVAEAGDAPVGLIVFDTHLDLSESFGGDRLTRASPLLRIAELDKVDPRRIVVIGARGPRNLPEWTPLYRQLGITVFSMAEVERLGIDVVAEQARKIAISDGARLYISLDIDGVDPAYAPATNSPESGGLTSREIIRGVRIAARDGFSGFDLVEVSPDFDSASGTTCILAARLLAEALFCLAANKGGKQDAWRHAHAAGRMNYSGI
ncbi:MULTISPECIES: agmatinase family protein [unclassified Mesorhizobium]|uniref:agmatinase family protein n=1 Tax=unclassified Mesorhizobium TaxID=325217 RepID=UPI00112E466D|nr:MULTISPECIES: agmatinase family protein [unclassified Mesorhizobium]MBZ9811256.1 agmatinase family protein [Mesorhizobium sp. ESP-6-2]TPM25830.1 agmatinase [Mesorhizobium sp. B2-2-2]